MKNELRKWLLRETENLSVMQVSELPIALATDKGNHRAENQDKLAVLKGFTKEGKGYLVAALSDGMGGMENGGDCAALSISSFIFSIIENIDSKTSPRELLDLAAKNANSDVYSEYNQQGGATLSAVIFIEGEEPLCVNAGDTRIYLSLHRDLIQLTEDDTLAAQVNNQPYWPSNQLLQYVGMGGEFEPHIISFYGLQEDFRIVITSDGIHFMESKTIQGMVNNSESPKQLGRRLVELSKWLGSKDNASVIVIDAFEFALDNKIISSKETNLLQLYDAYGLLYFMAIVKTDNNKKNNIKEDKVLTLDSDNTSKTRKTSPSQKKQRKNISLKNMDPSNANDENKSPKEKEEKKPQLKIKFDE